MSFAGLNFLKFVVPAIALAWGLTAVAQFEEMGEIRDFRVPEFDADGTLKSEIFGDLAKPLPDNKIAITGLRIVMYKGKGVDATLTAAHCTVDRRDKNAFSNAEMKIVRGNVTITGKGFRWSSDGQRIEVLNKFHMVMTGSVKVWPLVKEKQ